MIAIEPAQPDKQASGPPAARRSRSGPLMMGVVCGSLLTVAALASLLLATRNRTPPLTDETLQAAIARWDGRGLQNYDLDIELSGSRPGTIHAEVRDNHVTLMTRDGVKPRQKRTWAVWSVPGMFDTLQQELDNARRPADAFQSKEASQMVMWAEFDREWGYPRQFDRVVLGADFEVHWTVTRFVPLDGKL